MNQYWHRVDKCIIHAFPLVFSVCFLSPLAFAGGFDTPSYDENFPESPRGNQSQESQLNQAEQVSASTENEKQTRTILPTTFNFADWKETQQDSGINCKSDGFNVVCLSAEQAESLAW